jgi:hypothetical protein
MRRSPVTAVGRQFWLLLYLMKAEVKTNDT